MAQTSNQEDARYQELLHAQSQGQICNLTRQVFFRAVINGVEVFTYTADFAYIEKGGIRIIEEFKGHLFQRHDFQLRMKVCSALYPQLVFRTYVKDKVRHIYQAGKLIWHYRKPPKARKVSSLRGGRKDSAQRSA